MNLLPLLSPQPGNEFTIGENFRRIKAAYPWYSVKDYGAKGDGVTDDSGAFTRAEAAGSPVYVPPGSYYLASTVGRITNAINIFGYGPSSKIIVSSTPTTPGLSFSNIGDITREATTVSGLNFDGGVGQALSVTTVSPFKGENLRFNTGAESFIMTDSYYGELLSCSFKVSGIKLLRCNNFKIHCLDMNGGADWTGSQAAYAGRYSLTDYAIFLDDCTGITFAGRYTMEGWYTKLVHLKNGKQIVFDQIWFEQNRGSTVFQFDLTSDVQFLQCNMDFYFGSISPYPVTTLIQVDHSSASAPARIGITTIAITGCNLYLVDSGVAINNFLFCKGNSSSYAHLEFEGVILRRGIIALDQYSTATVKSINLSTQQSASGATVDTKKFFETLPVAVVKETFNSWVPSSASANWDFTTGTNGGANFDETTTTDLVISVSSAAADVYTGSRSAKIVIGAAVTTQHIFSRLLSDMGTTTTDGQTYFIFVRFKTSSSIKLQMAVAGGAGGADFDTFYEVQTKADVWVDYIIKTASDTTYANRGFNPRLNFYVTNNSGVSVNFLIDRIDYKIVTGDVKLTSSQASPATINADYSIRSLAVSGDAAVTGNETVGGTLGVTGLLTNNVLTASKVVVSDGSKRLASGSETGSGDYVRASAPLTLAGQWAWNSTTSTLTLGNSSQTQSAINISSLLTGLTGTDQRGLAANPTFGAAVTGVGSIARDVLLQMKTAGGSAPEKAMAINVLTPSIAGTAPTTLWGLKIEDQSGGSTNNAIETGAGTVLLGDNVKMTTAGKGLFQKEGGGAAKLGPATLVTGTITVNTTAVTASSRIFIQRQTDGGTVGASYSITRVAGTSFTIQSKDGTGANQGADTSTLAWWILEPS